MAKDIVACELVLRVLGLHNLLRFSVISFHCVKLATRPCCMHRLRLLLLQSGLETVYEQGFAAVLLFIGLFLSLFDIFMVVGLASLSASFKPVLIVQR